MAELTISAAVGATPAPNLVTDVTTVQTLLNAVNPPLKSALAVTGVSDAALIKAIKEFQKRFFSNPDGRVDPGGRTLFHLNNHGAPNYKGCSASKRKAIDKDLILAQNWLDVVNRRLGDATNADLQTKVDNIFHVNPANIRTASVSAQFEALKRNFRTLRTSMDTPFPVVCEAGSSLFQAYVIDGDATGTMYFPSGHFVSDEQERIGTVIHERSHSILGADHDGMRGVGELDFDHNPDDPNPFTHAQAMNNAYCYGWLAMALQPTYTRWTPGVITP